MSSNKVKRLSKTITKEIVIEETKEELKPGEVKHIQRNQTPDNSKCCGIFSCCGVHNTINGNNNNVNTDKNTNTSADVNLGINK